MKLKKTYTMKKTISVLIALVAFAFCMNACTNAQAKQNRSDDDIKEEVARQVKEIYDTVIPWYNSHEGDIRSVNDFDGRFLSKDMQMMRAQVGAILRELHEKGEDDIPPGFDYEHWVMGQDWENLSIRTDSIRVLSPDTAEAYMCITNYGSPQKFMLMMTRDETSRQRVLPFPTRGTYRIISTKILRQQAKSRYSMCQLFQEKALRPNVRNPFH